MFASGLKMQARLSQNLVFLRGAMTIVFLIAELTGVYLYRERGAQSREICGAG